MSAPAEALSTQLLVQFLTAVSLCPDEASAVRVAAERAAEAFEAEVGAVEIDGVVTAVGFPEGEVPTEDVLAVTRRTARQVVVPGVGLCSAMAAPLADPGDGHLLVARSDGPGFSPHEAHLLRGMARAFHVVLRMLRTVGGERGMRELADAHAADNARLLESLRVRHRLLEQLVAIQRAITRRAPLDDVLGAIVGGAHELMGDDVVALCLVDREDPGRFVRVTSHGLPAEAEATCRRSRPSSMRPPWRAIASDRVVVQVSTEGDGVGEGWPDGRGPRASMAAPVHEHGETAGALVVASLDPGRSYTVEDEAVLEAFAEQVSLAITDARTLAEVHRANHDPVTGLASRRMFMERLTEALQAPSGALLALLFVDLDRFKVVNDTLGHAAGDQVLVEVSRRIRSCLRAGDSAARFGGDEFAVLAEGVERVEHAAALAERIGVELRRPTFVDGRRVFIDASIGIVTARPGTTEAESLVRDADVAMYAAKEAGAGRHVVFDIGMRERSERQLALETDLRAALAHEELTLQYQPIVDLASRRIVGMEALVRWFRPGHGWVPPLSFIPVAEEIGLILPLGEWVLREACRQAVRLRGLVPGAAFVVSVNLSGRQLQEPGFPAQVAAVLADSGLPAEALVLELTESIFMQDSAATIAQLSRLKSLGVSLAVDDFGSGASSLAYLRAFPVDILKIDKSFVDDIATDPEAARLVRAIVELATVLRVQTVAEGVESSAQWDVMRESACELGQGYAFSRPLDVDAFEAVLMRAVAPTAPPARR